MPTVPPGTGRQRPRGPTRRSAPCSTRSALRAERRGAYRAAADAHERSAELTVDPHARAGRRLAAARNAWAAGQAARASALLPAAREQADDPLLLADVDRLRARIEFNVGSASNAHRILTRAAHRVSAHDPVRALEMASAAAVARSHGADSGATLPPGTVDVRVVLA